MRPVANEGGSIQGKTNNRSSFGGFLASRHVIPAWRHSGKQHHAYYIEHNDADGESLALFVTARNAEEAVKFWCDHFELEGELPASCMRLPDTFGQLLGPVSWPEIKQCLAFSLAD